jgi:hypothetical protein
MKTFAMALALAVSLAFTFNATPAQARGHGFSTHSRASTPSYGTGSKSSSSSVRGYTTRNGTYVAPYARSRADKSINNNWSTKGNVNPRTGAPGTKRGNPYGR